MLPPFVLFRAVAYDFFFIGASGLWVFLVRMGGEMGFGRKRDGRSHQGAILGADECIFQSLLEKNALRLVPEALGHSLTPTKPPCGISVLKKILGGPGPRFTRPIISHTHTQQRDVGASLPLNTGGDGPRAR